MIALGFKLALNQNLPPNKRFTRFEVKQICTDRQAVFGSAFNKKVRRSQSSEGLVSVDPIASKNVEVNVLNKLMETIEGAKVGLDSEVIAKWYAVIENDSKALCPSSELRDSIHVVQNPVLPMKFQFKSSKRAIPYVVSAIESNLNNMPFATRLYFQKFEEIMQQELTSYMMNRSEQSSPTNSADADF